MNQTKYENKKKFISPKPKPEMGLLNLTCNKDTYQLIETKKKPSKKASNKKEEKVSLGYQDEIIGQDQLDPFTSKLGGLPDWLTKVDLNFEENGKCGNCNKPLCFILQIYAPFSKCEYDRTLYLFACVQPQCGGKSNSIKVLRAMKYNKEYAKTLGKNKKVKQKELPKSNLNLGGLWGNNFKVLNSTPNELNNSFSKLNIDEDKVDNKEITVNKVKVIKKDYTKDWNTSIKILPSYYIAIEEEYIENELGQIDIEEDIMTTELNKKYQNLIEQYKNVDEQNNNEEWAEEQYEKSIKLVGADKTFLKFSNRNAKNPEQIFRYDLGGEPLLYTRIGSAADKLLGIKNNRPNIKRSKLPITLELIEPCPHCNANRQFEFQLMPNLLACLPFENVIENTKDIDERNPLFNDSWEFGTIFIFTCKNNCKEEGLVQEIALVQLEP